jgi:hypothetical protein
MCLIRLVVMLYNQFLTSFAYKGTQCMINVCVAFYSNILKKLTDVGEIWFILRVNRGCSYSIKTDIYLNYV